MKFLKNLSIRTKLFLLSVIPSMGLIYLLFVSISASLEKKNTTEQVYEDSERAEKLSALLHELQQERGFYLVYIASGLEQDREKVLQQVMTTDNALEELHEVYTRHNAETRIFSTLDSLDVLRQSTSAHPEHLNRLKALLLDEIYHLTRTSQNPEIKHRLEAHLYLLYMKEYFARMKNILLPLFVEKKISDSHFGEFASSRGQYEFSRKRFTISATPDLLAEYRKNTSGSVISDVYARMDSLYLDPANLREMTPGAWWTNTNVGLGALAETERYSLEKIREKAQAEMNAINRNVISNVVMGVLILSLIALLISFTVRQIVAVIAELKSAAQKLAKGEVDFLVNVRSKDEMGDLALSFNQMVDGIKQYAHWAEKIGKGDYEVEVVERSPLDVLGIALNNMKKDLQRLSRETEVRTWLLTGNSKLNDRMRGEKELTVLAQEVIAQLSELLNAQIGAFYVRENGHFKLAGQYAYQLHGRGTQFQLGEGLVGQAGLDGKHILLTDVPDDYLKVQSALGEAKPRNIIVYPFKYEGEVKGVLEIGSSRAFSQLDIEFLDLVKNHIGIAVNASQSRQKLKELLEETQRQSEELETQQEELRQFNEELLEKTHLLERSEEELKTQQEELQQSNEELVEKASLLEEQKQNLEFTKLQMETKARELEMASQYKTEFLSNMSHELRTPLNSILILAQVLMENRNKTLSPKEVKFANTIFNSGNDLLNLINEILDLSKIEAGKMELDVNSFSLPVLAQNMTNAFEELARSKKIIFKVRSSDKFTDKVMISDVQRVEQILKNFLSNAFKFTPEGGKIQLDIDEAPRSVRFRRKSLQASESVIAFTVSDTGIGIPREKQNIIFEAFQQVDGSTKRQYGGTGLGLSISRELAKLLGGEIHIESELGKGSSFTLYLPAEIQTREGVQDLAEMTSPGSAAGVDQAAVESVIESAQGPLPVSDASHYDDQHLITEGDRKILIMEDDVEFSKVLLDFVHERNYKGIIAHQGNVGLSYARHYKPDAIILDMKLPVVDGAEVLKKLKSDPELRHIPVQIISGFDFRKSALELGAIDFIPKPVSRDAFWKALDKVEYFASRKPKKLLIIEDDIQHNQAVKELIGNGDVKCYSAYSGKEAFEMLSSENFDCIIVDLGLPDMTGFTFLEKIRENQELNRIPLIVYTGKDLSKQENARLEKLANTVVLKTAFSNDRLLDETTLFLHRVESKLPREKQNIIRKLHKTDEVLRNKRVLIVDDDDRNVYSLLTALEQEGIVCLKAGNGKEALDVLRKEERVDLVLMDVMMPEMDGFEATRAIRGMAAYRKLPIIALTAKAMKDDREKCLAAGMSDYISKPLNIQQLLSLMRVWLYA